MQVSHFSKLLTHRQPVLCLYRQILRHIPYLNLNNEHEILARQQISWQFRQNKSAMSAHYVRKYLENAHKLEAKMRDTIVEDSNEKRSELVKELQNAVKKAAEKTHRRDQISNVLPLDRVRNDQFNQAGQYHFSEDERSANVLISRRDKVRRRLLVDRKISAKAPIDTSYIDTFASPEHYIWRENKIMSLRRKREVENGPPRVRIRIIATPRGPYSYMTVQGRYSHPHTSRSRHISRLLADRTAEKLERAIYKVEEAKREALWEQQLIANNNEQQQTNNTNIEQDWVQVPVTERQRLTDLIASNKARLLRYRKVLIAHKLELDRVMERKHAKNKIKWANYTPLVPHKTRLVKTTTYN